MEQYEKLLRGVSVLARHHQNYMAKRLGPVGIGMGQYFFVLAVIRNPGIGQDNLARRMLLNKSTVTRAVAQLEENGYLRREVNPDDARALQLYPTEKAEEVLPLIDQCLQESAALLTEGLSQEESDILGCLVDKALTRFHEKRGLFQPAQPPDETNTQPQGR